MTMGKVKQVCCVFHADLFINAGVNTLVVTQNVYIYNELEL